jgi:hypothetical protein
LGREPRGRLRYAWDNNITMKLQNVDWKDANWIEASQHTIPSQAMSFEYRTRKIA